MKLNSRHQEWLYVLVVCTCVFLSERETETDRDCSYFEWRFGKFVPLHNIKESAGIEVRPVFASWLENVPLA